MTDLSDKPHGKASTYSNYKCRCADCKKAWAEYSRNYRKERRKNYAPGLNPRHGTISEYARGCKCLDCLLANKTYKEQLRHREENRPGDCAICKRYSERLIWDHDHTTGKHRGWLCLNCNHGLGLLRDNIDVMQRAIEYLDKTRNCDSLPLG